SMPDMEGTEVLRRIRDMSNVPVLMLTANAAELSKARSLNAGADDYVTKPFGGVELEARIRALLRRSAPERDGGDDVPGDAVLPVDAGQGIATAAGKELSLTPREFSLLAALVRHPNQVLRHEQLAEYIWGTPEASGSRDQIKVYVRRVREKI